LFNRRAIGITAVAGLFVIGAVASANDPDKIQGVVQVSVVNDTGLTLRLGLCHNQSCSETDVGQVLKPGDTYDQAVEPNESQLFAVAVAPEGAVRSAAVTGEAYRCTQLTSGAQVAARYLISGFVAC
jgi:hypothetical protein